MESEEYFDTDDFIQLPYDSRPLDLKMQKMIALIPPKGERVNIAKMKYWWYRLFIRLTCKIIY